jgi:hypothetical protein
LAYDAGVNAAPEGFPFSPIQNGHESVSICFNDIFCAAKKFTSPPWFDTLNTQLPDPPSPSALCVPRNRETVMGFTQPGTPGSTVKPNEGSHHDL